MALEMRKRSFSSWEDILVARKKCTRQPMKELRVVVRLQVVTKGDRSGEAVGTDLGTCPGQVVPGSQPSKVLRGRGHLQRPWGMGSSMEK